MQGQFLEMGSFFFSFQSNSMYGDEGMPFMKVVDIVWGSSGLHLHLHVSFTVDLHQDVEQNIDDMIESAVCSLLFSDFNCIFVLINVRKSPVFTIFSPVGLLFFSPYL